MVKCVSYEFNGLNCNSLNMFLQKPHVQLLQVLCWPETQLLVDKRNKQQMEVKLFRNGEQLNGTVQERYFTYVNQNGLLKVVNDTPYQTYYDISKAGLDELEERGEVPAEANKAIKEKEEEKVSEKEEDEKKRGIISTGVSNVRAVSYKLPKGRGYVVMAYTNDLESLKELKKALRMGDEAEELMVPGQKAEPEAAEKVSAEKGGFSTRYTKKCDYCGSDYEVKVLRKSIRNCCSAKSCQSAYASEKLQLRKAKK